MTETAMTPHTTDRVAFGRRLIEVRKALGIDQRDAAQAAGVTPRIWRRWEAGHEMRSVDPVM